MIFKTTTGQDFGNFKSMQLNLKRINLNKLSFVVKIIFFITLCPFQYPVDFKDTLMQAFFFFFVHFNGHAFHNIYIPNNLISWCLKGTDIFSSDFSGLPCLLQLYTRLHLSDYRTFWNTERWKSFD